MSQSNSVSSEGVPATLRGRGPLADVRVMELASVWAGPCAGMFLGMLGASVVKVESRIHPDLTRRNSPDMFSSPTFQLANLSKRSAEIDFGTPGGRAAFLALCAVTDIVISNVQPDSLERKGVGYEQCRARNPRLIWAQISTSGTTGPERHYAGYAPSFNALSGLSVLSGYDDGPPAEMRSAGDMRVAYDLVLVCLAALLKRRLTGEGMYLDLSCREVLTARIGDLLIGQQMEGRCERTGNARIGRCPRGVYPCLNDGWLAIEVEDEERWRYLTRLIPDLDKCELHDPMRRWTAREEVDAVIARWTRERTAEEAAAALQDIGVAAAPSMPNTALAELPHLWQRRLFFAIDGEPNVLRKLVTTPWGSPANIWPSLADVLDRAPPRAPRLGEHTEEVLSEVTTASPANSAEYNQLDGSVLSTAGGVG